MVPGYNNSAMDGYALRAEDQGNESGFKIVGTSFAGEPFLGRVNTAECVRIMTGAEMPDGSDSVIMQENAQRQGETVSFSTVIQKGDNVRLMGNDISIGDTLLSAGRRLSPTDIGLLASLGLPKVEIYEPIKVGLFSTGDELRLPGETLQRSCLYDSNRFVIAAMLKRLGCEVLNLGIIKDDPVALKEAFKQACEKCDAIITSGGVSVGEADYTKEILDELGSINFWKLAIKPGKPFAFGSIQNDNVSPAPPQKGSNRKANPATVFFGLPGNPVSATVTFHQLALPCLQIMSGETTYDPLTLTLPANTGFKKRPERTDFQRGKLTLRNGNSELNTTGNQSSGMLTSMSQSNCYVVLDSDQGDVSAGEPVTVIPYDRWLK